MHLSSEGTVEDVCKNDLLFVYGPPLLAFFITLPSSVFVKVGTLIRLVVDLQQPARVL